MLTCDSTLLPISFSPHMSFYHQHQRQQCRLHFLHSPLLLACICIIFSLFSLPTFSQVYTPPDDHIPTPPPLNMDPPKSHFNTRYSKSLIPFLTLPNNTVDFKVLQLDNEDNLLYTDEMYYVNGIWKIDFKNENNISNIYPRSIFCGPPVAFVTDKDGLLYSSSVQTTTFQPICKALIGTPAYYNWAANGQELYQSIVRHYPNGDWQRNINTDIDVAFHIVKMRWYDYPDDPSKENTLFYHYGEIFPHAYAGYPTTHQIEVPKKPEKRSVNMYNARSFTEVYVNQTQVKGDAGLGVDYVPPPPFPHYTKPDANGNNNHTIYVMFGQGNIRLVHNPWSRNNQSWYEEWFTPVNTTIMYGVTASWTDPVTQNVLIGFDTGDIRVLELNETLDYRTGMVDFPTQTLFDQITPLRNTSVLMIQDSKGQLYVTHSSTLYRLNDVVVPSAYIEHIASPSSSSSSFPSKLSSSLPININHITYDAQMNDVIISDQDRIRRWSLSEGRMRVEEGVKVVGGDGKNEEGEQQEKDKPLDEMNSYDPLYESGYATRETSSSQGTSKLAIHSILRHPITGNLHLGFGMNPKYDKQRHRATSFFASSSSTDVWKRTHAPSSSSSSSSFSTSSSILYQTLDHHNPSWIYATSRFNGMISDRSDDNKHGIFRFHVDNGDAQPFLGWHAVKSDSSSSSSSLHYIGLSHLSRYPQLSQPSQLAYNRRGDMFLADTKYGIIVRVRAVKTPSGYYIPTEMERPDVIGSIDSLLVSHLSSPTSLLFDSLTDNLLVLEQSGDLFFVNMQGERFLLLPAETVRQQQSSIWSESTRVQSFTLLTKSNSASTTSHQQPAQPNNELALLYATTDSLFEVRWRLRTHGYFDAERYAFERNHSSVTRENAFTHYRDVGHAQNHLIYIRSTNGHLGGSGYFNPHAYWHYHPDLQEKYTKENVHEHFLEYGEKEKRVVHVSASVRKTKEQMKKKQTEVQQQNEIREHQEL